MTVDTRRMAIHQIYKESGIAHIRYDGKVETSPTGQNKIEGSRPAISNMNEQV